MDPSQLGLEAISQPYSLWRRNFFSLFKAWTGFFYRLVWGSADAAQLPPEYHCPLSYLVCI
jgi:hypothetical protein